MITPYGLWLEYRRMTKGYFPERLFEPERGYTIEEYLETIKKEVSSNKYNIEQFQNLQKIKPTIKYTEQAKEKIISRAEKLFIANNKNKRKKFSTIEKKLVKLMDRKNKSSEKEAASYNKSIDKAVPKFISDLEKENKLLIEFTKEMLKFRNRRKERRKKYGKR